MYQNASQGDDGLLVTFCAWHLLPIIIQCGNISLVICAAQSNNLVFLMSPLTHHIIDLVIQILNLIVHKAS